MKKEHTPGPWKLAGPTTISNADETIVIGYAHNYKTPRVQTDANARLIAAAPELLEALKDAVCALQCSGKDWPAETKARAAIAKATGEAP
jgi:hypothetical protein